MIYGCFVFTKNPEKLVSQHLVSDFSEFHDSVKKMVENGKLEFLLESEEYYFIFQALAYYSSEEKK